jgi:hypothetical protein
LLLLFPQGLSHSTSVPSGREWWVLHFFSVILKNVIVVLGGNILWPAQMFLQYIKYNTLEFQHSPSSLLPHS